MIWNIDARQFLSKIKSNSIDCVVTDPPYKIVQGGHRKILGKDEPRGILCHNNIDTKKGKLFKYNDIEFKEWLPELYRVLKNGTHCYIMINSRNLKKLQIESEKVGFNFINLLVWDKQRQTPNKYYMQRCEFILLLRKGRARNINNMGSPNLISLPTVRNRIHPTQKPIKLMEMFIKNSTQVGDIVIDPFAGSGTTAKACKKLGRRFYGSEIDENYYIKSLKGYYVK